MLEYNEQIHSDRNKRCKLVRMADVSLGYGGRPVFWIRFTFKVAGKTLVTTRETRDDVLLKVLQDMVGN